MSADLDDENLDIFEKVDRKQRAIDSMLENSPIVNVSGVIDPSDVGGSLSQGETLWRLSVPLAVWKVEGQSIIRESELNIRKRLTRPEMDTISEAYSAYGLFSARIRLAEPPNDISAYGLLLEILPSSNDQELLAAAKALQTPVTFQDSFFGHFKLDRRVKWFDGETKWCNRDVRLNLDSNKDPQSLLSFARELWNNQESWDKRVREFAAKRLTPIKNEHWRKSLSLKTSEKSFARKIRLESITIKPDKRFEFLFDDGGLFWGHAIIVYGDLVNGPDRADLAG